MTVKTVWPNADVAFTPSGLGGGRWVVYPSGTAWAALDDTNESDFLEGLSFYPDTESSIYIAGLGSYTLLSNEKCFGARAIVRRIGAWVNKFGVNFSAAGITPADQPDTVTGPWSIATNTGTWRRFDLTQSNIDNLQFKFEVPYQNIGFLYWAKVELDVYTKPTLASVTHPTGGQGSRIVTTTWTGPDWKEGGSYAPNPTGVIIKFFKTATYSAGGFNPETAPSEAGPTAGFIVGDTASGSHTYTPPNLNENFLGDGVWKAYVCAIQNHQITVGGVSVITRYASDWVAGPEFGINQPPPVPTFITPAEGAVVNTDLPTLGGTVNQPTLLARSLLEWQLATDAGFTANVRNQVEPTSALRLSGASTMVLSNANSIFQGVGVPGVWYYRARQVDQFGTAGAWSPTQTFSVFHSPSPAGITPSASQVLGVDVGEDADVTVAWSFNDPSPIDGQTSYQIIVERTSTGAVIHDTGVVTSANQSQVITIDNSEKDISLRLKVRLGDRDSVVGPYSAYQLFMIQEFPIVDIGFPTENEVCEIPQPDVVWGITASLGRTQSRRRVMFGPGPSATPGDDFYDTGWVVGATNSHMPPEPILDPDLDYWVEVQIYDSANLLGTDRNYFFTAWEPPLAPIYTIDDSGYDALGYIVLAWTDDERDPDFSSFRIYRRIEGATSWTMIYETEDDSLFDYTFSDWLAGSGYDYEYKITQRAVRFGSIVEGPGNTLTSTPVSTHYWLIHPDDETLSVALRHVTNDSFTDEYEEETFHILGRGRHMDIGDRLGYDGSLGAELRDIDPDGPTAREQRLALEALRASRSELYLRNPFGDVFLVKTGDLKVQRLAGVGRREFSDVDITYSELAE